MVEPAKNDDTVFLVGGLDDEDDKAKMTAIFQLVCDKTPASCKWETSEVKMKYGRELSLLYREYGHNKSVTRFGPNFLT